MAEPVLCGNCKMLLDEAMNLPLAERQPCPTCGSRNRLYSKTLTAHVRSTVSLATVFAAASAVAGYAVARIMQRPPSPDPGYHPSTSTAMSSARESCSEWPSPA
jgi:hypothetical protein